MGRGPYTATHQRPIRVRSRRKPGNQTIGHRQSEHADLAQESHLVIKQLLLDDLAVLPARHRAELELKRLVRRGMNFSVQTGCSTSSATKLWEANQQNPSGTAAHAAAKKVRMYWCNLILQAITNRKPGQVGDVMDASGSKVLSGDHGG